jgi:hypothetical protein
MLAFLALAVLVGIACSAKGKPEEVRVHDFIDRKLGKVAPYGVGDLTTNTGWVSVGIDHDTAEVAVESIRRWWREMGQATYPNVRRLLMSWVCQRFSPTEDLLPAGERVLSRLCHSIGCRFRVLFFQQRKPNQASCYWLSRSANSWRANMAENG